MRKHSELDKAWIAETGASEIKVTQRCRKLRASRFLPPAVSGITDSDVADFILGMLAGEDNLKAPEAAMDLADAAPYGEQVNHPTFAGYPLGMVLTAAVTIARKHGRQIIDAIEVDAHTSDAVLRVRLPDGHQVRVVYRPAGRPVPRMDTLGGWRTHGPGPLRMATVRILHGDILMRLAPLADGRAGRVLPPNLADALTTEPAAA